jgi:hypothetical protein
MLARGPLAILALVALGVAGCGDGPICQEETLVFIASPQGAVLTDSNAAVAGVQTDVVVRSTLRRGLPITLFVTDAGGTQVGDAAATTDDDGNVVFEDVTIPVGGATLKVVGEAGECGRDEDEVQVELAGGGGCMIAFVTPPVASAFYAPLDVFTKVEDGDPAAAGYQGDVTVTTTPGHRVKLYVTGGGMLETEVGAGTADDDGEVTLAVSLPEGVTNLRAACTGEGGLGDAGSGVVSVFVDTVAPACEVAAPVSGTSITPALDADADLTNGVQLTLTGHTDDRDTEGEEASFVITAPGGGTTTLAGSDVTAGGDSSAAADLDPASTPAVYMIAFTVRDHAGNECSTTEPYRVVYDGCPIIVTAPLAPVTVDADNDGTNGAQIDIVLDVDDACVGEMVTSDCGSTDPGAAVPVGGGVTLRASVCATTPCESAEMCVVRVTSPDGIETTAGVDLRFDNVAPNVSVSVAAPGGVACGGVVTPEQDVDPIAAGIQARMRVNSQAADRRLRQVAGAVNQVFDANAPGGEVVVTLEVGVNTFTGIAADALGNTATSAPCNVSLADIVVTYTGAAADGTVGVADGTVANDNLTFNLTGTVSIAGATVTVTVDGGPAQNAVVNGTAWSLPLTLAGRAAPYAIVATATAGMRNGRANLSLTVDLSGPPVIGGVVGVADTRQSIRLTFNAPSDNGAPAAAYRIRYATVQLTDANFDATGTAFVGPAPGAPGAAESIRVRPLRAGTAYWVGIAAVDAGGNRSPVTVVGPLTPRFDQSPTYASPNVVGNAGFGYAMVRGRFNDDDFEDVAVSAPFVTANGVASAGEVYVYLGSPVGLAVAPATTIRGVTAGAQFGTSLAHVRWGVGNRDDLVIGEPFGDGFNGVIYVFSGGAGFPVGTVNAGTAPRRIGVNAAANWFSGSALGWQLAAGDHDGDGGEDLFASAVFGAGGSSGAALVFYGGTVPLGQVFISDTSAAGSGTAVIRMYEDPDATGSFFGFYLHNLGKLQGPGDTTDDLGVAYAEDGLPNGTVVVYRGAGLPPAPGVTRAMFTVGRDVRVRQVTVDTITEWGSTMGSIADQNGDGAREIVIGDYRFQADNGIVYVIDGDTVGTNGTADTTAPGVALTAIAGPAGAQPAQFGMAVLNNANGGGPDVDGDGIEDLVIAGRAAGSAQAVLNVWFGPIGAGVQNPPAPNHVITGPATFQSAIPGNGGSPITAIWSGDVNADGLGDICWADWTSATRDGGLQVLWDDGM